MIGPDAWRYLALARNEPVCRPFHLRWLLPLVCGQSLRRWWAVRWLSWPVVVAGMVLVSPDWRGVAAAVLLVGLPGVLGPPVVRPVGVDLPAMALGIVCWGLLEQGYPWPAAAVAVVAAAVKESAPVWAALWAWSPVPLIGLVIVVVRTVTVRPGLDRLTEANPTLREVHDHPVRTALVAHRDQWRDAWVTVAPWGACLASLYGIRWPMVAVLIVAHLQLLVATDTVRLLHTAAGPAMAVAAAAVIPLAWLPLACVAHLVWWRRPVLI